MLRDEGPLTPLAGCTDLYVNLNFGTLKEKRFLNLWPLDTLRGVRLRDSTLVIGALTTYTEIQRSPLVRKRLPMLAAAAREVGGVQIQNRGTIGGNVVNASPAGDTLPVLAAAEAILVLGSAGARRRVPFGALLHGLPQERDASRRTAPRGRDPEGLRPAALPQGRDPGGPGHLEGRHGGRLRADRAHRDRKRRADCGPGAAHRDAPGFRRDDPGSQAFLAEEIAPIDDLRSTAEYRRRVAANVLERFWRERP